MQFPPTIESVLSASRALNLPSGRPLMSPSMDVLLRVTAKRAACHESLYMSTATVVEAMKAAGCSIKGPDLEDRKDGTLGRRRRQGGYLPTLQRKFRERLHVDIRDPRTGFWTPREALEVLARRCLEEGHLADLDAAALDSYFAKRRPMPAAADACGESGAHGASSTLHRSLQITPPSRSLDTPTHLDPSILSPQELLSTTNTHPCPGGMSPPGPPSAYLPSGSKHPGTGDEGARSGGPRRRRPDELEGDARVGFEELLALTAHLPDRHASKFRACVAYDLAVRHPLSNIRYAIRRAARVSTRGEVPLVVYLLQDVLLPAESVESTDPEELQRWWVAERSMRTKKHDRLRRAAAWRLVLEDLRTSLVPRIGEASWHALFESSSYLGYRGKTDFVQVRTREQRSELQAFGEDLDIAIGRVALLENDPERRRLIESLKPEFVVHVHAPSTTTVPNSTDAALPIPSDLPTAWESAYRLLAASGVGTLDADELVRHNDGFRITMVVSEANRPSRAREIKSKPAWIVGTLRRLEELDVEEALKVEILLSHGMWRGCVGKVLRIPEYTLEVLLAALEKGYAFQASKGARPGGDLGGWLNVVLLERGGSTSASPWSPTGPDADTVRSRARERANAWRHERAAASQAHRAAVGEMTNGSLNAQIDDTSSDVVEAGVPPSATPMADLLAPHDDLAHVDAEERRLAQEVAELSIGPEERREGRCGDRLDALSLVRSCDRELLLHNIAAVKGRGEKAKGGLLRWSMANNVRLDVGPHPRPVREPRRPRRGEGGLAALGGALPAPPSPPAAPRRDDAEVDSVKAKHPLPSPLEEIRVATSSEDLHAGRKKNHDLWWRLRNIVDASEHWLVDPLRESYVGVKAGKDYVFFAGMWGASAAARFHKEISRLARGLGMRLVIVYEVRGKLEEVEVS